MNVIYNLQVFSHTFSTNCQGAGEDRLHVMTPTAAKAADDPQLFPHPPQEGWLAVVMAKSQIPMVQDNMNQGLQHQHQLSDNNNNNNNNILYTTTQTRKQSQQYHSLYFL